MPPERRRLAILLAVLVVVGAAGAYQFWPVGTSGRSARVTGRSGPRGSLGPASVNAPDVHLRALQDERAKPDSEGQRDLFRFRPKAPPPRPVVVRPVVTAPFMPAQDGPPPAPVLPPIAMRFIGIVEAEVQAQKIAILSDSRGIYQGREGDIIEGRFRILRIGVESVEMAYLDGRGRQTIRLSGS